MNRNAVLFLLVLVAAGEYSAKWNYDLNDNYLTNGCSWDFFFFSRFLQGERGKKKTFFTKMYTPPLHILNIVWVFLNPSRCVKLLKLLYHLFHRLKKTTFLVFFFTYRNCILLDNLPWCVIYSRYISVLLCYRGRWTRCKFEKLKRQFVHTYIFWR